MISLLKNSSILLLLLSVAISCTESEHLFIQASNSELELENGVLYYLAKPFTGSVITTYPDGKLASEIQYEEGRKDGEEKNWYEDRTLALERSYSEGYKTGIHRGWWPDGTLQFEYHFNQTGEYNGAVKEWYANGQSLKEFNFVEGMEMGSQKLWQEDGRIKANYEVRGGERFGLIGLKKCHTLTENSDEII
ncbi:hypothetical protein [Algoriphagus aquimarinus]|uniref:toxin-antitoxin system YwqK family antitoxin n=1 Tax=Algoriphagus aquimarinus TaxID=237018 RepID=UPI0030DA4DAA|tara:strand:+ start:58476 stop:59051 length:576 start_codon:yes stop_codon:yes gene_type:complete